MVAAEFSLADVFSTAGKLYMGNWEFATIIVLLIAFTVLLAQTKLGSPATIVIMLFFSYALFLLGEPWTGLFYAVILVTGVVIARAILRIGQQQS